MSVLATSELPVFPKLDDTLGPYFVATYIGLIFYGITIQQAFRYYRLYPSDTKLLRALVIVVLVFETIHTILCIHVCYVSAKLKFTNPLGLFFLPVSRSLQTLPLSAGLVVVTAHCFYVRRAYLLGPRWRWLLAIAAILIVVELGFSAAASAAAYMYVTIEEFTKVIWLISTACGTTAFADIFLCTMFIDALHRSRTGFRKTDTLINTLILYAVGTGLLNSLLIFLSFVFSIAYPNKEIYAGVDMAGTKLYSNMLLVALNSRQTLREIHLNTGTEDGSWPFGFTTIPPAVLDGSRAGAKGRFGLDLGFNAAGGGGGVPVELRDFRAEVRLVLFLLLVESKRYRHASVVMYLDESRDYRAEADGASPVSGTSGAAI